ncbi:MAG TPA: hypothetical protein VKT77_04420 [Chthonomonadaceae bacterium]|nr:hypothetical protein [Chthonomonadaceae bacterium]
MSSSGGFSDFSQHADGKPVQHHHPPSAAPAPRGPAAGVRNTRAVWLAFLIACIGYLITSSQQPAGWGVGLWMLLAWLLIPTVAAFALSRVQAPGRAAPQLFKAGMKGVGWAMFLYSAITLRALAHRVGGGNAFQGFIAGLLTCVLCTVIAGAVAGGTNVLLARLFSRRTDHGRSS